MFERIKEWFTNLFSGKSLVDTLGAKIVEAGIKDKLYENAKKRTDEIVAKELERKLEI